MVELPLVLAQTPNLSIVPKRENYGFALEENTTCLYVLDMYRVAYTRKAFHPKESISSLESDSEYSKKNANYIIVKGYIDQIFWLAENDERFRRTYNDYIRASIYFPESINRGKSEIVQTLEESLARQILSRIGMKNKHIIKNYVLVFSTAVKHNIQRNLISAV